MKKYLFILLFGLLAIIVGNTAKISKQSDKIKLLEANELAYQDSLHSAQVKIGEADKQTLYWQQAFVSQTEELELSKDEIKRIEKTLKSKLAYIAEIKGNVRVDSVPVYITKVEYVDSTGNERAYFECNEKWYGLSGSVYVHGKLIENPQITDLNMTALLTVGVTKDNKISVTSSNPYITITDINGTTTKHFDYKQPKKRWHLGVTGGFGAMYGLSHKQFDFGPMVGVGLTYNIF